MQCLKLPRRVDGVCLKHLPKPQEHSAGFAQPQAEGSQHGNVLREQRHADEPDRHVAEKNNDAGKEVSLAGDVGLAYAQNVDGQREMKGVGGADQKMKPDQMALPIPDQVAESEN